MYKVLFIGNFLSSSKGSKGIIEKFFTESNYLLISKKENKFFRLIEFIFHTTFDSFKTLHIDVYSGQAFFFAEICCKIGSFRRKKIILTLRGGALSDFFNRNPQRIKKLFKKVDYIQSPSLFLQSFFHEKGYKVNYLPNPIDLSKFHYKRNHVKKGSLLWVRAFTDIYNPEIPVLVLHKLIQIYPDAQLTMVGPDRGKLLVVRNLIKKLGLEAKISITGPIPNDQLSKYYQTHQVYLNTTSFESFGVAVVEAAASGIPIVSNKVGQIPFMWKDNEEILMVEDNDIDQFVRKITLLFTDAHLSEKLSVNARNRVEEFDWQKVKDAWSRILEV